MEISDHFAITISTSLLGRRVADPAAGELVAVVAVAGFPDMGAFVLLDDGSVRRFRLSDLRFAVVTAHESGGT